MDAKEEFLRPADLARALGVSRSRIYQLFADGELPFVRLGGAIRIPRAAWDRWLATIADQALAAVQPEAWY